MKKNINIDFGILCAVQSEAHPIKAAMRNLHEEVINRVCFYVGQIANKNVVLVVGGVGTANAAAITMLLNTSFNSKYILFSGSSGRINSELNIGDVILSSEIYSMDFGDQTTVKPSMISFGLNPIRNEYEPVAYYGDKYLLSFIDKLNDELHLVAHDARGKQKTAKIIAGKIASSDHFPNTRSDIIRLRHNSVDAIEMESAALMKICWLYEKPCLSIRGISNIAGPKVTNPHMMWNKKNERISVHNACKAAVKLIEIVP